MHADYAAQTSHGIRLKFGDVGDQLYSPQNEPFSEAASVTPVHNRVANGLREVFTEDNCKQSALTQVAPRN